MSDPDHTSSPKSVKQSKTDKVKDSRERGWFWLDNDIVEQYLPEIGTYGMAIYSMLCFHADKSGKAFPSLSTIAKKTKSSRPTVLKYLGILEKEGLISIDRVTSKDGDHDHNVYTILNLPGGKARLPGSKSVLPGVVNVVYQGGKRSLPEQESIEQESSEQDILTPREKALMEEIKLLKAQIKELSAQIEKLTATVIKPENPVLGSNEPQTEKTSPKKQAKATSKRNPTLSLVKESAEPAKLENLRNGIFDAVSALYVPPGQPLNGYEGWVGAVIQIMKQAKPDLTEQDARDFIAWWKARDKFAAKYRDKDKIRCIFADWLGERPRRPDFVKQPDGTEKIRWTR